jgi:hypothetical protein
VFTFTTSKPDHDTIRKICAKWSLNPREVVTLNEGRTPLAPGEVSPKDRPWREGSTMILASEAQDNGRAFSGLEKRIEQECPSLLVESVRALGIAAIYLKPPPPPPLPPRSQVKVTVSWRLFAVTKDQAARIRPIIRQRSESDDNSSGTNDTHFMWGGIQKKERQKLNQGDVIGVDAVVTYSLMLTGGVASECQHTTLKKLEKAVTVDISAAATAGDAEQPNCISAMYDFLDQYVSRNTLYIASPSHPNPVFVASLSRGRQWSRMPAKGSSTRNSQ